MNSKFDDKYKDAALGTLIVPITIIEAYEKAKKDVGMVHPYITVASVAFFSIASFLGLDDGMPSTSSHLNTIKVKIENSRSLAIALAKLNFILQTDYSYLILDTEARQVFLKRLSKLKVEIAKNQQFY